MKMKNLFYSLLFATALVSAACSNDLENDGNATDPSNKTAISLVGEDNSSATTRYGFKDATLIAMHIRSTSAADASGNTNRETRTWAYALKDDSYQANTYSNIEAPIDENVRYWDDAFGRDAQLSVFAVAVPGAASPKNKENSLVKLLAGSDTWSTGKLSESIDWTVSTDQSGSSTINNEDLTYSNNISKEGKGGVVSSNTVDVNGYLKFRLNDQSENASTDGPGKFDQGSLKFYHALSRMTVHLKMGDGYSTGFSFPKDENVTILGVPVSGKFDIENEKWDNSPTIGNITKMATAAIKATGASYSLFAQILPGYTFNENDFTNVLEFVIDDNKYFITQGMMLQALNKGQGTSATSITMGKGNNYVFTITVGKSKIINVTATLEPWNDVDAENVDMDNSHITLDLFTSSGSASSDFDIYRLNDPSGSISTVASDEKNWIGNYTDKATSLTEKNGKWETNWFFDDNKSFYHFRTVKSGVTIEGAKNDDLKEVPDYFTISSGAQDKAHDFRWGAPFVKEITVGGVTTSVTSPFEYDVNNGYAAIISPAIGATNSLVNITELHMMSNIVINLQTTDDGDKVDLTNSKVYITRFAENGTVLMGTGKVTPSETIANQVKITANGNSFSYAVVPQPLSRGNADTDYIGVTIVTSENNQYYIVKKLSEVKATSVKQGSNNVTDPNQPANVAITRWFPGHTYTYTFTLKKSGIDKVTCTVEDWVYVTAENKNISLED